MTDNESQVPEPDAMPELPPPPAPKKKAGDVLGGGSRPLPKRFSRKMVSSVSLISMGVAAGVLIYGLFHQPNTKMKTQQATPQASSGTALPFGDLTNTYTTKSVNKSVPPPAAPPMTTNAMSTRVQSSYQGPPQLTDAQKETMAAQTSGLFFKQQDQSEGQPSYTEASATAVASNGGPSIGGGGDSEANDPNVAASNANNAFIASKSGNSSIYASPLQSPISPYEVQAGSVIPAALITKSVSDLPGDLTAQVTENVYDSATGKYLLIPQGSRLFGSYSSLIAYGQNRSLIVWSRLILPNGNSLSLGGMIGSDSQGASGMTGNVNHHNLSFMGALAVATLLSVGPAFASDLQSTSGSNNTIISTPAQYASSEGETIGEQLVAKELSRPNTITLLSGQPLDVLVNKDLILKPYKP